MLYFWGYFCLFLWIASRAGSNGLASRIRPGGGRFPTPGLKEWVKSGRVWSLFPDIVEQSCELSTCFLELYCCQEFWQFLPLGTSAEGVMSVPLSVRLSVCLSVRPSVHFWLVCTITRHIFNLWLPNLHQLCILPTHRLLSKIGSIDLDLQGYSGLKNCIFVEGPMAWISCFKYWCRQRGSTAPNAALVNLCMVKFEQLCKIVR